MSLRWTGRLPGLTISRSIKSAAFPILIVVVLAFFAQRLIAPNDKTTPPDFPEFLAQVDNGDVKSVEMRQKDNTAEVKLKSGEKYEVGFVDGYGDELTTRLLAAEKTGDL